MYYTKIFKAHAVNKPICTNWCNYVHRIEQQSNDVLRLQGLHNLYSRLCYVCPPESAGKVYHTRVLHGCSA